ncbi:hypothetical protein IAR50_003065 [Cryptococcus sp. DSM 104548]
MSTQSPPLKRRKTLRACDSCRESRIRCEYEDQRECKHCRDYGIRCVKIAPAPIDKRRKVAREGLPEEEEESQDLEPTYLGPSSLTQLIHTSLISAPHAARDLDNLGNKYDFHWDSLGSGRGAGLLRGREEGREQPRRGHTTIQLLAKLANEVVSLEILNSLYYQGLPTFISMFPVISASESALTKSKEPPGGWLDRYSAWNPNSSPPTSIPRIIRLLHCTLSSLSRLTPPRIRHALLSALHKHLRDGEAERLAAQSTIASSQVLVLMGMNSDLHGYEEPRAASAMWQRTGMGIRMATDLGVHRKTTEKVIPIAQIHRRARLWGGCVITDKWAALRLGQVQAINLDDCDCPLPFRWPDHYRDQAEAEAGGPACFATLYHLTKLSIILGDILRITSSPQGLARTTDQAILQSLADLDAWSEKLPTSWAVSNQTKLPQANAFFNLMYCAVEFTLLRPFLFPIRSIPAHITYRPDSRLENLIHRSEAALDWLSTAEGEFYLDVWGITVYPLVTCILLNLYASYHSLPPPASPSTASPSLDPQTKVKARARALHYLEKGHRIVRLWVSAHADGWPEGKSSWRGKVGDMVDVVMKSVGDGGGEDGVWEAIFEGRI